MSKTCKPLNPVYMPCPMCGTEGASINVQLAGLTNDGMGDEFQCMDCDATFGRAFIELVVSRWSKMLKWMETIPQFDDE